MILHTRIVTETGGGPDKTILNSPRHLIPYGYDVLCAFLHPPGDPGFEVLRRRAEALGAPIVGIEDRRRIDRRAVRQLDDICRERGVTIWHGHDYKTNLIGLAIRRRRPMKLVTTVHGWVKHARWTWLYYRLDRWSLRYYDRVICVSDDLREACLASGVRSDRCRVIENAIDTEQFVRRMPPAEAKRRLGVPPERLTVGYVGRLSAEKNLSGLLRGFQRVVRQGCDLELLIAGDGEERANLETLAAELGVGDRVRLLGFQADPREIYEAMDLFALNSLREGLPNVVLEAMALETPVLATRIAGVPRVVTHDRDGLLIDPGDEDQLVAALTRLACSPELRARLAAAGRTTVETRYSFAARMAKMRALYDEMIPRD